MMQILKISGILLIAAGVIILAFTLISARRKKTFAAVKELRRIRSAGYIKEHKEERTEDVYKKELISEHSRRMSRRAKRVLENMEKEDENHRKPGIAKGTSVLEEVGREQKASTKEAVFDENPDEKAAEKRPIKKRHKVSVRDAKKEQDIEIGISDTEEDTAVLREIDQDKRRKAEDDTGKDILEREADKSDISRKEESTAVLGSEEAAAGVLTGTEEATAMLTDAADTDVFEEKHEYASDPDARTDILPDNESTGILGDTNSTVVLSGEDQTGILREAATDILPDAGDNTAVLEGNQNTEDATSLLRDK